MDFIETEAFEEDTDYLSDFSDSSDEDVLTTSDNEFIDDSSQLKEETNASFYRSVNNLENYFHFFGQTKNPIELTTRENIDQFGDDNQPELFDQEDKEKVEFDEFENYKTKAQNFKTSLLNFKEDDVENNFFYAVIYGISHIKLNGMNITFENIKGTLGERLFLSLKCIEQQTKLDHTLFGYFERCQKINEVLTEFGYFLRFYD